MRRILKNSYLKKILNCYSEDIVCRKKNRSLSGIVRAREKRKLMKEWSEL